MSVEKGVEHAGFFGGEGRGIVVVMVGNTDRARTGGVAFGGWVLGGALGLGLNYCAEAFAVGFEFAEVASRPY